MGLLETTARDGTACGLLAFHDSAGDPMMVTLSATGIFGVGEGSDAEGYTSCMLIFRCVSISFCVFVFDERGQVNFRERHMGAPFHGCISWAMPLACSFLGG
jgi:hypothetical protein